MIPALLTAFTVFYLLGIYILMSLDDLLLLVTDANTKTESLVVLTTGLKKQLDDALSGVVLPPAVQAKVDAIFNAVQDEAVKVEAALVANTPQG